MFRISKLDGTKIGITDSILYIKIGSSGCFTPCSLNEAIGIAFDSTPYNAFGYNEIEGADKIILEELPVEDYIMQHDTAALEELATIINEIYISDLEVINGGEN